MKTNVQIPGFEGREVVAVTNSLTGRSALLIDGQPAAPGPKRGQFLLRMPNGREATAYFKPAFPDTVPVLMVDEQPVRLAPKLEWYELVWACFPIGLLFIGGLIGAVLGAVGASLNLQIFRSTMPVAVRYVLAAVVTLCCLLLFIIVGSLLQAAIRR
jgi:hypothetical protein